MESDLECVGSTGQKHGDGDIGGEGESDEQQQACCEREHGLTYGEDEEVCEDNKVEEDFEEGEGDGTSLSILRGGCCAGFVTATGFTVLGANAEGRPGPSNPALGCVARLAAFNA